MKNKVSEERVRRCESLCKEFRMARAATGLSSIEIAKEASKILGYDLDKNTILSVEKLRNYGQESFSLSVINAIISVCQKKGYCLTSQMKKAVHDNTYIETSRKLVSKTIQRELIIKEKTEQREKMRKAASEVLSKVSLTPHNSGELKVPTEDRFLREKVASLSTDVSHIKKMINMIAKELGLEK